MENFKIIPPSPPLAPFIKNYWLLKTAGDGPACVRTVPTGMMSLVFHRGTRLLSVQDKELHPRAFLTGQEKTFADLEYAGQVDMISIAFRPAGVRAFFNLPANKINNLRVTPGDLEDKELGELERRLTSTDDDLLCITLIEQFMLNRLSRFDEYPSKRITTAIQRINSGQTDVAGLARAACLSRKQFQRLFSAYVGANPKEFSRIIRFQQALHRLEVYPQTTLTALAYECGYFDQSHLIKDFKALSGYTPGEYLAACPPHSDYFS